MGDKGDRGSAGQSIQGDPGMPGPPGELHQLVVEATLSILLSKEQELS